MSFKTTIPSGEKFASSANPIKLFLFLLNRFSIGFYRFSGGFHTFSVGFYRFSIGCSDDDGDDDDDEDDDEDDGDDLSL